MGSKPLLKAPERLQTTYYFLLVFWWEVVGIIF